MATRKSASNAKPRLPEISMETIGSFTLRVGYWPAERPSDKRPLLFFNGIGANMELAFGLGDWIRDREILTFDMPGVGESEPARFPYRPWMMARVARKLCDQYDMGDVDVMGVSWGGAMAQQYAFQYRNSVGKLVLVATTAGMTMVPGKVSAISKMADARRYTDPDYMRENFQRLYGEAADGICLSAARFPRLVIAALHPLPAHADPGHGGRPRRDCANGECTYSQHCAAQLEAACGEGWRPPVHGDQT